MEHSLMCPSKRPSKVPHFSVDSKNALQNPPLQQHNTTLIMDESQSTALLLASEDVVLSIVTFLSAQDCLNLHQVSCAWHDAISKHDATLFENFLRSDFDEGGVLAYVAKKRNMTFKKLYRAFRGRWSLPKQADVADNNKASKRSDKTRILVPWSKPPNISRKKYQGAKLLIPNNDVDNVVFIARIKGEEDGDSRSALLEWNRECPKNDGLGSQQLIIDKSWCDDNGEFALPKVTYISEYDYDSPLTLTLHAIDTKYYQVASLLDNSPVGEEGYFRSRDGETLELFYGDDRPTLYAIPPKGSPYYREFTDDDLRYAEGYEAWDDDRNNRPHVYTVSVGEGCLQLKEKVVNSRLIDDDYSDEEDYEYDYDYEYNLRHPTKGMYFSFGDFEMTYVKWPHHACSFLRALMREKCLHIEPRGVLGSVVVQQPEWVQDKKILDTITSFLCFEDQAGKLRLVCRQFGDSASRQLRAKLEKSKRIGSSGEAYCEPYQTKSFVATVRRGWSEDCLTSKESSIDDALWMASCRCARSQSCGGKASCKSMSSQYLECHGYNSTTKTSETHTIDMNLARQKLRDEGVVHLTEDHPDDRPNESNKIECKFEEDEMNLFDLCRKVEDEIFSEMDDGDEWNDMPTGVSWSLKIDYGVLPNSTSFHPGYITQKQFLRSIFLLFTRASGEVTADEDGSKKKKARSAPSQKVTIAMAQATYTVENGNHHQNGLYSRRKKIIRFYSADNEPFEVCFESRQMLSSEALRLRREYNRSERERFRRDHC